MNKSRSKLPGDLVLARDAVSRCMYYFRRTGWRTNHALEQVAASSGLSFNRCEMLFYNHAVQHLDSKERHNTVLGACAARMWLVGWLRALANEIESETALIEGAENQRYVREWVVGECVRLNGSSPGRAV